jgi:uncharacterized protein
VASIPSIDNTEGAFLNPFKYGTPVSGNDFCSRQDIISQISDHIKAAQNIIVLGERRMGKTSLIFEAAKRASKNQFLYVNLLGIKSIDMMCKRILRAVVLFAKNEPLTSHILEKLSYLHPVISVDPITKFPTLSLDANEVKAETILEILDFIKLMHSEQPLVVVFDEFQDVLKLADADVALSLLGGKIQFHSHTSYIFAGSARAKAQIFTNPSSALSKSAIPITVGPIDQKEFGNFLNKKFANAERKITDVVLERVFIISGNVTGDVQQLCNAIWEISNPRTIVDEYCVKEAVKFIFLREKKSYELVLSLLTKLQFQCLLALCKLGGANISSNQFVKACGSSNPSSVRKAVLRLVKYNFLFESELQYKFINPFFRAWMLYNKG